MPEYPEVTKDLVYAYLVKRGYNLEPVKSILIFSSACEILFTEKPNFDHFTSCLGYGEWFIAIIEARDYRNESVTNNLFFDHAKNQ